MSLNKLLVNVKDPFNSGIFQFEGVRLVNISINVWMIHRKRLKNNDYGTVYTSFRLVVSSELNDNWNSLPAYSKQFHHCSDNSLTRFHYQKDTNAIVLKSRAQTLPAGQGQYRAIGFRVWKFTVRINYICNMQSVSLWRDWICSKFCFRNFHFSETVTE